MLFTTDKQTLEDLNILGKPGSDSIYSLYNRTVTVNGAAIMEEMFRNPLSEAGKINDRSRIIRYLATMSVKFPFRSELFDQAEQYLSHTDERTRLSTEKRSLEAKLTNLIGADASYKVIYNGIIAIIEILQQLETFIATSISVKESPYQTDKETMAMGNLLAEDFFCRLIKENPKSKIPHLKVTELDHVLRFQHRDRVKKILQYIYYLDVYTAVAKVAVNRQFVFPHALPKDNAAILIEGFYHPRLTNGVPNTIKITPENNIIFLTGANMAGKSTFMKSLGIAMYLAHMGFPVPAKKMEFSVMDGIYTTINLADNLSIGASHFYAEVLRIKKIAKELSINKNIFVVFDELFRGTNVKDAYEATIAITTAFATKRDSFFIISTHIIEAGEVLKKRCANISFKYLPTIMNGTVPEYTYTLSEGITADRHGMVIINNERILDILKKKNSN